MLVDIPNIEHIAPQIDERYLRQFLVACLYNTGKLSAKEACEIISITRREFEALLPRFGLAIFPDTQKDIENELRQ
jgi:predicted HTH domain antitoxin